MNKKLFVTTFVAILAAAAVIIAGLGACARVAEWTRAWQALVMQQSAILEAGKRASTMHMDIAASRAPAATDYGDVLAVERETTAAVVTFDKARQEMFKVYPKLIALLEHKPFGLPLTSDERGVLAFSREQLLKGVELATLKDDRERSEGRKEIASTPTTTPSPTPTTILSGAAAKALAVHAPPPQYPYQARSRHITGSGVCVLTVDPGSGSVTGASMAQSIGSPILDIAATSAFRQWRFKPGTVAKVRMPITFTMTGASY